MQVQTGEKTFRESSISGVKKHYPGEPKPAYMSSWADMPAWEQQSAARSTTRSATSSTRATVRHRS